MRKSLLGVVALVLVVTGCKAEANIVLSLDENGSGAVTAEFGVDEELMELLERADGGPEDLFEFAPEGEDVETRVDGDMTYYAMSEPFADTAELEEVLAEIDESDSQFADVAIVVDDDGGVTLDATLLVPDTAAAVDSLAGGAVDIADDVFSANFFADLPGELVESNADEVLPDGRLAWDIPFEGGEVDIRAVTSGGGGGTPIGLIVAFGLVALLVAAAAVWSARRRRASRDALAATAVPEPPQPMYGETVPEDTAPPPEIRP